MSNPLIQQLLAMHDKEASDLHLVPGYKPTFRIHGELVPAGDHPLDAAEIRSLLTATLTENNPTTPDLTRDVDMAFQLSAPAGVRRFRANVFSSRGELGACFRSIPEYIPTLPELGFASDLGARIIGQKDGLILITGITGSGKTTSVAALIQMLNSAGGHRIITIEEPIEYVYPSMGSSIITQREVGADVASFYEGLRYGLRQDPDVLLVGEIRDVETAQLAISAAETGHLIFATMHTRDAKGAITRLTDLFPAERHDDIRSQLSMSLRFVVAQHLLPAARGGRRVLAMEVLAANHAVKNAIRTGKIESLDSAIQSSRSDGMFPLDADLRRLAGLGAITLETARSVAADPTEFGGR